MRVSLLANGLSADKKQLEAALAAVEADLKTPAGQQYDEQVGKEFMDQWIDGSMDRWIDGSIPSRPQALPAGSARRHKTDSFEMLMKINSGGQVAEVLVYPESPFAGCTRTSLLSGKFSTPPHDNYWVNVHIEMKH